MGFFKKIFGNFKNENSFDKSIIDELLSSTDNNNVIIKIDDYICKLCSHGDALENLNEQQKNFYLVQNIEREINNGGFNQYFFNSSGNFSHDTIRSLQAIGALKTANILQHAIDQFPNSTVPKKQSERRGVIEKIEEIADEVWGKLDRKFLQYEDNLSELIIQYIKENQHSFIGS